MLARILARSRRLVFLTTDLEHSLVAAGLNAGFRRRMAHVHLAGGPPPGAYRRKRWLNRVPRLRFVAVSAYTRAMLELHGTNPAKIVTIENFLDAEREHELSAVGHEAADGPLRVLVISYLVPYKRVDMILDAIDLRPELRSLPIRVVGDGPDLQSLRERATSYSNVTFAGFVEDVERELARTDLLLHLCPVEAFGLGPLEAMIAGVPVLVPNRGGAAELIEPGVTGFRFRADDASDLAARLAELSGCPRERLGTVAEAGRAASAQRFRSTARGDDYRRLVEALLE